jgi:uncharacterized protein YggU (UPF0235/DUF167 family)
MADSLLTIQVQPRSSRDAVVGDRDGAVLIRLRAAPVRGFSGEQLRRLLLADAPGSPP